MNKKIFPVAGACRMSSKHFGYRSVDVFAPVGRNVLAVEKGKVRSEYWPEGGYNATLTSVSGREYYYGHLESSAINGPVKSGDVIGQIGRSGNARNKCSHLHIAVSGKGKRVDDFGDGSSQTYNILKEIASRDVLIETKELKSYKSREIVCFMISIIVLITDTYLNQANVKEFDLVVGASLCIIALGLISYARKTLFINGQDMYFAVPRTEFIHDGPYKFTNKPIGLGLILFLIGIAVITPSIWAKVIIFSIIFFIVQSFISKRQY